MLLQLSIWCVHLSISLYVVSQFQQGREFNRHKTFERFPRAVRKASQRISPSQANQNLTDNKKLPVELLASFVFVKDWTKLVKVWWDDIL